MGAASGHEEIDREEPMGKPVPRSDVEHASDLLAFQRRAREQGWPVQLPAPSPEWALPEPVDLDGASLGDIVVRLRRGGP